MGQKKSKTSYDVAPVVSDKDFKYESRRNTTTTTAQESAAPVATTAQVRTATAVETTTPVATTTPLGTATLVGTAAPVEATTTTVEAITKADPIIEIKSKLVPAWVKPEYFQDILRANVKDFAKIKELQVKPAIVAVESYATLLLRIKIQLELETKKDQLVTYMLKVPHDNAKVEQLSFLNYFPSENAMYNSFIPAFEQFYRDVGVELQFAPKYFKFQRELTSPNVLMEDLCQQGYKNIECTQGLDMAHVKCALKKLAQFHAASAHYVATKGAYPELLLKGHLGDNMRAILENKIAIFKTAFLNNLKTHPEGEMYGEVFQNLFTHYIEGLVALMQYNDDDFNVLNHGDCWSNNILFQYAADGTTVTNAIFVDFQCSKYGSPAQDLYYLLMSSANIDIKLQHFDYFIRYYYDHLIESLQLLKYPKQVPMLRELHVHLYKYGLWAFNTTLITLPFVLLDSQEQHNIERFTSDNEVCNEFRNALYGNKRYQQYIEQLLPWLYNRGLLEDFKFSNDVTAVDSNADKVLTTVEATTTPVQATTNVAVPALAPTQDDYPDWVSEAYFVDVVRENVAGFKEISSFVAHPATAAGENYGSKILQIDIVAALEDGSQKSLSYMLKIAPNSEQMSQLVELFGSFRKEREMYADILPQFEQLYKNAGKQITFAPNSYNFTKDTGSNVVLLENLRPRGFKNADRLAGFDMEHTKCVLSKLAAFHAVSAHYYATKGPYSDNIAEGGYIEKKRPFMMNMLASFHEVFSQCLTTYNGHEEYIDKVREYQQAAYQKCMEIEIPDENGFNVLCHGDAWANNILFQYDAAGKIENTYLVDYQMVKYGSPTYDLYYFLLSSTSFDIKLAQFDYFIRYYHEQLIENLTLLQYPKDMPTLKNLHIDLLKRGIWGLTAAVGIMSVVLLDPTADMNSNDMLEESDAGKHMKLMLYSNARYRKNIEAVMLWLNRRGLLETA